MTQSVKLRDYPGGRIRLACDRCTRTGQYHKDKLVQQPDLRHEIANCDRLGKLGDPCGVHYRGLTASKP